MKKFIKLIAKNLAAQTIAFLLLVGFITFAAITWPSQTPAGETSGGKFQSYFNNLKGNCPSGQAVVGINNDFTKKCGDIIQTPISTPINGVCNNSTIGGCSSGSVNWINNTTSCGTTAIWTCKGSNGGTDSSQCIYNNGTCIPTTPTCPTNYSYISVNGVSGCYTFAKVNGENLNCDDTSMINAWYKEKGRCGENSALNYWKNGSSPTKNKFIGDFNNILNNQYGGSLSKLLCADFHTYQTNTTKCKSVTTGSLIDTKIQLNCNSNSVVNAWYKEKGRCGDDSGISHRESELKKDFVYSFNQAMSSYNYNLSSLLCPQGATYITNTEYCKK